jgi:MFS family permease
MIDTCTIKTTNQDIQKVNMLAYLLSYVGFMTLTLSMSLTPILANTIHVDHSVIQIAMSLSFFMFSMSAVIFATLSDIFTARKVLVVAQCVSITGLILLSICHDVYSMYMGFVMLGIGTGCYASISRAIISRNATDKTHMKRAFAVMSCCIIIAPVISTYLALVFIPISWRMAYVIMAIIEISLMLYSLPTLRTDAKKQVLILKTDILSGFKHALSQPTYVLNIITVAVLFSFYLGVLMSSFKGLIIDDFKLPISYFTVLFLAASLIYILGIFSYRYKSQVSYKKRYNLGILLIIFIATVYYTFAQTTAIHIIPPLHIICYLIGFLAPLATGNAMATISKGHGSAAAMVTFAVSFCMAIWEYLRAHLQLSDYNFILLALWVTLGMVTTLKIIGLIIDSRTNQNQSI